MKIDDLYTSPPEEASEEIRRRWNDPKLRKKVQEVFPAIPDCLADKPKAILWRAVATPDLEMRQFLAVSARVGLEPLCTETLDDIFCTWNPDKLSLAKMYFYNGRGKHGGPKLTYRKILDMPQADNKPLRGIKTLTGEGFVDFHHRLIQNCGCDVSVIDFSRFRNGKRPLECYEDMFTLAICNSVLFENYLDTDVERPFSAEVVIPAFERVTERFGLRPLILPIVPLEDAENPCWWWYPSEILRFVDGPICGAHHQIHDMNENV